MTGVIGTGRLPQKFSPVCSFYDNVGRMWALVCGGPFPTGMNFKSLSRGEEGKRWARRKDNTARVGLDYMRRHAGLDVSLKQIEAETGHSRSRVSLWLAQGARRDGLSYLAEGLLPEGEGGVYRYEEAPLLVAGELKPPNRRASD